ncbi:MAG: glycoside hydrolase family 25 protein [Devosiaceae bacterium]|nr:glycoside hydrolase family 25 protein [Devosiaceae bacterium]
MLPDIIVRNLPPSLKFLLATLLLSFLSGCFSGGVIKGDNAPHAGVREARILPVQGIDISRYQGDVDFRAVKRAGTRFAFIKATEGGDYLDPAFARNWAASADAGLVRGAYHFMTWCRPAEEQAAWFAANVPNDPYSMPPVLDLEWNNHSRSCPKMPAPDVALEQTRIMLAAMEAHSGKLPIIYTDINFHRDVLAGKNLENTFWLRSTAANPREKYFRQSWTFWQWTQTGTMPGIVGEVDRNSFYGSDDDWIRFVVTGCDPRTFATLGAQGRCGSLK